MDDYIWIMQNSSKRNLMEGKNSNSSSNVPSRRRSKNIFQRICFRNKRKGNLPQQELGQQFGQEDTRHDSLHSNDDIREPSPPPTMNSPLRSAPPSPPHMNSPERPQAEISRREIELQHYDPQEERVPHNYYYHENIYIGETLRKGTEYFSDDNTQSCSLM